MARGPGLTDNAQTTHGRRSPDTHISENSYTATRHLPTDARWHGRHAVAMTYPRHQLVAPGSPGVYHCVSRCVRRAFLCGEDRYSGQSFEHRRQWVEDRLHQLAEVFAVSLWAYAVMSNHLHVVVQVLPETAAQWTDDEVARRWICLFPKADQDADVRAQAVLARAPDTHFSSDAYEHPTLWAKVGVPASSPRQSLQKAAS